MEHWMPERPQGLLIGVAGVLTAAIAVVQAVASVGSSRLDGLAEGLRDQLRGQRIAQCPADDLAAEQVDAPRPDRPSHRRWAGR